MAKPETPWEKKPLFERLAAVIYPGNTTDENRRQMQTISDANKKKSPQEAQGYGRTKR